MRNENSIIESSMWYNLALFILRYKGLSYMQERGKARAKLDDAISEKQKYAEELDDVEKTLAQWDKLVLSLWSGDCRRAFYSTM